ncbi:MAG: SdrD B-like domain-containing protein [Pirellulales bacterium]
MLLSGIADYLNPPASFPAPSDTGQTGSHEATAADTREYRDLKYLAQATPTAELPMMTRVTTPLQLLYSRSLQGGAPPVGQDTLWGTPYGKVFSTDGVRPHVQAFVQSAVVARSALEALGMEVTAVTDTASWQVVAGYLPVSAIGQAADIPGLGVLEASERGTPDRQGNAANQWETVSYADQLKRVLTSVDGNEANMDGGIEVGVISDSMNQVGNGVAGSQATGDLPPGNRVQVLDDGPGGGTDEGRAMAELAYDVGPAFNIVFHSGSNSSADMAGAFDELRRSGADIITDDISYFTEPVFQDGQIAEAVDEVYLDHGVLAFGSAGNRNNESYYATWNDADNDDLHNFQGGDETLNVTLQDTEQLRIYLQWSEPWLDASTDIDIELYNADLSRKVADSDIDNNPFFLPGGLGLEYLTFTNNSGAAANYHLAFRFDDGDSPEGLALYMFAPKDRNFSGGSVFSEAYVQNQPAITGNHAAVYQFSMGAVPYNNPGTIRSFSSRGPNTIFFSDGGDRLDEPEVREKPDFVAADRVDNTFFPASLPDFDGTGFPNFSGTSAASPNAAAVAGLVLDAANRRLSYSELSRIFAQTATGTGAGGWDPAFGEGLINALGAGLVARGVRPNELYLELNPFGDFASTEELSSDSDTDRFVFTIDRDGATTITVTDADAQLDPGVILWNADSGAFLEIDYNDAGGGGAVIDRSLGNFNLYQAEVFTEATIGAEGANRPYTIEVNGPDPALWAIATDIYGDGYMEQSLAIWDSDYYVIEVPDSAWLDLTVTLTPEAPLDGVLTVYDENGAQVRRRSENGAGGVETTTLNVQPGQTYYVRVGSYQYASAGDYRLDVDFDLPFPTEMVDAEGFAYFHNDGTSHDTQTFSLIVDDASIDYDDDVDSFFFASEVEGTYTVSVTQLSGTVQPVFAVYDAATGARVTLDQGHADVVLSARHRYIVAVADALGTQTGDVAIEIVGPEVLGSTPVAINADGMGSSQDNELDVVEDSDFFRFAAPADADGSLTLTVSPHIGLDAAAILFDAAGNELAKSYTAGLHEEETIVFGGVVPSTTYYLTVLSKDYASRGHYDVAIQFGLVRGSIRGTKFYDLDQDGVFDEGEPGLEGWIVYADQNGNQQLDLAGRVEPDDYADGTLLGDVLPTVHLRAAGRSVNNKLIPVVSGRPASTGWKVFGNGWSDRAEWAEADAQFVAEFLQPVSRVSLDFIADDALDTGVLVAYDRLNRVIAQVATGPMIAGEAKTLTVQLPGNDIDYVIATGGVGHPVQLDNFRFGPGPGEPFAFTDIRGQYAMEDLSLGTYPLREVLQDPWQQTAPAGGEQSVTLSLQAPDATGADFGNYSAPQIHGVNWEDLNGDGVRDAGEPGLAGWTIFDDWVGDGEPNPGDAATLTNASGEFWFAGLESGSHEIAEVLPPNWAQSYPEGWPSYGVDVGGQLIDGIDFGNYQYSTASGFVFNDLDGNGLRDQGEPGLDGWLMFVDLDGDGTRTVGDPWDTVHAGGLFTIMNVPPGTYQLRHSPQDGWAPVVPADDYYKITVTSGSTLGYYTFAERELLDFGDAPAPYPTLLADNGPRHRITLCSLGPFPDKERDGQPSASADADDTTGNDDEDGVIFVTALVPGQPAEIRVNAVTNYVTLDAWLDFNRDGDWDDAGERILDHEDLAPFGWQTLSFDVPGWSVPGATYARFRVSSDGVDSYTGPADSGEVEDYRVTIDNAFNLPLVVPPLEDYGPMNRFGDRNVAFTLDSPTDRATWRFTSKTGGPATFTATGDASSGLHPLLALYNGKGDLVAIGGGDPDPSEATLSYMLTPGLSEVYTLLVQDAELDTAGVVQSFFDTPTVSSIDILTLDAAGRGRVEGTLASQTAPPLADVDYYQLTPVGGFGPSNRLTLKVSPLAAYRLEFQLFDGAGNPVGDRVESPAEGQPAEHEYTGLPGGQSYVVAVFPNRFEDHPAGGLYQVDGVLYSYDCGDAPASYATLIADNGPLHRIVSGVYLGSGIDNEWDGRPTAAADGDDTDANGDDEDGVVFLEAMSPGHPTEIQVTASAVGKLDAWVDFNADGNFDLGEQVFTSEPLVAGPNELTVRVPIGAAIGATYARFRYSTAGGLPFDGPADDGEVEDYQVTIEPSGEIRGTVWHDFNTDGTRGTAEPGLAGWTVFLDDDNDGQFDTSSERSVLTDSGGNYAFADVAPGIHDVVELGQPGWQQVYPRALPQWVYVAEQIWRPRDLFTPAEFRHNHIDIYDQASLERVDSFDNEGLGEGPLHDIEVGPGGDVYAAVALGEGHGQIVQFTYEGEYVRTIALPDDALPIPADLPGGQSFFIDYPYPDGFDVLADGSLVVPQPANEQILILGSDGSLSATLDVAGFHPVDAGVLSDGTIVFTEGYPQNDPYEYMITVRPDDTYWVGTSEGAKLRNTDGEVMATRGDGTVEAIETADGTLFATTFVSGWPFELDETRLVKYDADGNELGHAVFPREVLREGWLLIETDPAVKGLALTGEVPYGNGPVRGDAGPQGFIAVGPEGSQLVAGATVTEPSESPLPMSANPVQTGRGSWSVVVEPGQVVTGADFGNVQESTASGVKFNDLDGDGIHDTVEPGLDGWVVWADLDDDGVRDGREPFATTAGGGLYTLDGILPGTYKIREEAQAGWTQTAPGFGYHEVQFTSGSTVTGLEFGNRQAFHVFVVNSTADPGDGVPNAAELTLREAITAANATANLLEPDQIVFDIPAGDPGHVYYHDDGVAGQVSAAQITTTTAIDDSLLSDADPEWPHSWFSIRPAYTLPAIAEAVVLDGYTQPGARANSRAIGTDAVLRLELDGSSAGSNASGVQVTGGGNTIRGLAINRFRGSVAQDSGFGIYLDLGDNNLIEGNFIGTDVAGVTDLGNATEGVYLRGSSGNRIGGTNPTARNVISGNNNNGINFFLSSASNNLVQGNYIGVSAAGTAALGNGNNGVAIQGGASFNTIGGTVPWARNVISGNSGDGIDLFGFGGSNLVLGNFIGTDATGSIDLGNSQNGVKVEQSNNTIGGTTPQAGNVISGNNAHGVRLSGTSATGNVVEGNLIGTNAAGTGALGNSASGVAIVTGASNNTIGGTAIGARNVVSANGRGVSIQQSGGNRVLGNLIGTQADGTSPLGNTYTGVEIIDASDNLIGGTDSGAGNTIAYSGLDGVFVMFAQSGTGNAILGNRIFANTGLGIDLNPNNVTPNDPGDADTGANNLQNFPVLTSATATGSTTTIEGSLNSTPNTAFRVELFANETADATGFGEGQTYLGSIDVTTDAAGAANFAVALPTVLPLGQFVTATATVLRSGGGFGDSSEYSQAAPVASTTGEIHGTVWHDANTDGTRGTAEPGLAGWTVFLDSDNDGVLDSDETSTATDAGGNYSFVGLEPGNYNVAQVLLPNWLQTMPVVVPERIYVAVQRPQLPFEVRRNVVRVYDFDGNSMDTIWHDEFELGDIYDVEIGPGGDVYVGLETYPIGDGQGEIVQFTFDGEFLRVIDLPDDPDASDWVAHYPYGFDVLSDGSLLVAQQDGEQIVLLDADGVLVDTFAVPGRHPMDVGVLSDGEIVYTYFFSDGDGMLNVRGDDLYWTGYSTTLFDHGEAVRDLLVASIDPLEAADGSLYATASGDWGLRKWDAEGNLLWELSTIGDAQGLAVARNEVQYHRGLPPPPFMRAFGASPQADPSGPASPAAIPTGRGNWNVVLGAGDIALGVDFGNVEASTASGVRYDDLDGDGARDSNEPGLDGWVIYADMDDDGVRDGDEPTATTAGGGLYILDGILPGTYKIREEAQAGWSPTSPAAGYHEVHFFSGSMIENLDFGGYRRISLSGRVFDDRDADGARDAAEPGLDGWTVFVDVNGDGAPTAGEPSATTAGGGLYAMSDLRPGTYRVRVARQTGWVGVVPANDYFLMTFISGVALTGVDFAERWPWIAGDADLDGDVDIFDVAVLQTKYGITTGAAWADGDFDGNGTVDIFDVALMQVNYGTGVAPAPAAAPETIPPAATVRSVAFDAQPSRLASPAGRVRIERALSAVESRALRAKPAASARARRAISPVHLADHVARAVDCVMESWKRREGGTDTFPSLTQPF